MKFNETYKTAALSTAHMTLKDANILEKLTAEDFSLIAQRPTGFFIKLHVDEPQINAHAEFSEQLNKILVSASSQGFECVEFDCGLDITDGLKVFDW